MTEKSIREPLPGGKGKKRVIIMGASSGIGLGLAEALASRGVAVGLAARHTKKLLDLQAKFPDCVAYERIDITHQNAPELLSKLIESTGGMDIYIHASGIGMDNAELDPQKEADVVNTNATGFARMLSAAYRYFRERGGKGQIAAITSVAGTNGIGRLAAYSASKAFGQKYLVALEQLAHLENTDVSFTDIRPGWVDTPLVLQNHQYPMEMSVDYVVPRIIRAIARKRHVEVIDWRWDIVVALWRCIPNALWVSAATLAALASAPLPSGDNEKL